MKRVILKAFAHIVRVHSNTGEVVAQFLPGFSFLLPAQTTVYALPPELDERAYPRKLSLTRQRQLSGDSFVASLSEIRTRTQAEHYVGKTLEIDEELLRDVPLRTCPALVIGKAVIDDVFGRLGTIKEVLSSPAQDVWVIARDAHAAAPSDHASAARAHNAAHDLMIPCVDAFIHPFSPGDACIYTSIPEGLLHI